VSGPLPNIAFCPAPNGRGGWFSVLLEGAGGSPIDEVWIRVDGLSALLLSEPPEATVWHSVMGDGSLGPVLGIDD
jgi:hypothetical protein